MKSSLSLALLAMLISACSGCRSGFSSSPATSVQTDTANGGYDDLLLIPNSSFRVRQQIKSWPDLKNENVVIQKYDYSCGAAALATMMRHYFGDDVSEDEVLKITLKQLSTEQFDDRQENGLSMNDLFTTAKEMGYLATVYRLPVDKIPELQAPVIVRIEKDGYKHFVVLRGAVEDRIYLADPTRGNIRLSVQVFLDQWSGEALIMGKRGFGLPKDHPLAIKSSAPVRNELETARRWLFKLP